MRVLMCRPEYFDVTYEINAWMRVQVRPDPVLAMAQWNRLYRVISQNLGAHVSLVAPQPGLPDMVFTANAGLVWRTEFIGARFRFEERQREMPWFERWFADAGYQVTLLPEALPGSFEGEGDILMYGDSLLAGYRQRSDAGVYPYISGILGKQILPLELVDTRWYHLDTCLFPLTPQLLAYYPPAFDDYAVRVIESLPGAKIRLSEHDALRFGANAVVVGNKVAMNSGCTELEEQLSQHGFETFPVDLSEFLKSGGAAKCLTLVLDHP